jgi:hypothetical protein
LSARCVWKRETCRYPRRLVYGIPSSLLSVTIWAFQHVLVSDLPPFLPWQASGLKFTIGQSRTAGLFLPPWAWISRDGGEDLWGREQLWRDADCNGGEIKGGRDQLGRDNAVMQHRGRS